MLSQQDSNKIPAPQPAPTFFNQFFSPQSKVQLSSSVLNESNFTVPSIQVLKQAEYDQYSNYSLKYRPGGGGKQNSQNNSSIITKKIVNLSQYQIDGKENIKDNNLITQSNYVSSNNNNNSKIFSPSFIKSETSGIIQTYSNTQSDGVGSQCQYKQQVFQQDPKSVLKKTIAQNTNIAHSKKLSEINQSELEESKLSLNLKDQQYENQSSDDDDDDDDDDQDGSFHMDTVKKNMFQTHFSNQKVIQSRPNLEIISKESSIKKNLGRNLFESEDEKQEQIMKEFQEIEKMEFKSETLRNVRLNDKMVDQNSIFTAKNLIVSDQKEIENQNTLQNKLKRLFSLSNYKFLALKQKIFSFWQKQCIKRSSQIQLQNAAQMVDKMTKFSKTFISINSISSFMSRKLTRRSIDFLQEIKIAVQLKYRRQSAMIRIDGRIKTKKLTKAFQSLKLQFPRQHQDRSKVFKTKQNILNNLFKVLNQRCLRHPFTQILLKSINSSSQTAQDRIDFLKDQKVCHLQTQVEKQQKQNAQLIAVIQQYKLKIDSIQRHVKCQNDLWKQTAQRVGKQNQTYKSQVQKLRFDLTQKTRQVSQLQTQIAVKMKQLTPVEQAFCSNCKNSLQESQVFSSKTLKQDSPQQSECQSSPSYTPIRRTNKKKTDENELKQQILNCQACIMQLQAKLNSKDAELLEQKQKFFQKEKDKQMEQVKQIIDYKQKLEYSQQEISILKNQKEAQIDIVLKMEEQRLLLLKENKETKDKGQQILQQMKGITDIVNSFKEQTRKLGEQNKTIVSQNERLKEQIENLNVLNKEYKLKSQAFETSQSIVSEKSPSSQKQQIKKRTQQKAPSKKKTSASNSNLGWKPLKFDRTPAAKNSANDQAYASTSINSTPSTIYNGTITASDSVNLKHQNTILTNDLINANRDLQKLKLENRQIVNKSARMEKQKSQLEKLLNSRNQAFQALKTQNNDLATTLNANQYKSIRGLEKQIKHLTDSNTELKQKIDEINKHYQEQRSLIDEKTQSIQSLQKEKQQQEQKEQALQNVIQDMENLKASMINMRGQLAQHQAKQVGWLSQSAKSSKLLAEKKEKDMETYLKILKVMESKINQIQHDKKLKECELNQLKKRIVAGNL